MLHVLALAPWLGRMSVILSGPAIAVDPPDFTGRAIENQELFQREIDQAVSAHGELADPAKAAFRVRVQVQEDARDYAIHLELVDAGGTSLGVADSSCDICSETEAAAQTGRDLAALLAAHMKAPTSARFTSAPTGATVMLDGTSIGTTPLETNVEPGPHSVSFEREGHRSSTREFTATEGKQNELHVDLAATDGGGPGPAKRPPSSDLKRAAWIGGWTGIGVGVVLLATGIALLAVDENEIKRDCSGANIDVFGHCKYRYNTTAGGAATTALGLVVAGTGIGFVVWSRPSKREQQLRANIGPTRLSFTLRF